MIAGVAGLALTIPSFLPPLLDSLLLGSSIGLIMVGPVAELTVAATAGAKPKVVKVSTAVRLKELVKSREATRKAEHEKILDNFDAMLSTVEKLDDPVVNQKVTRQFGNFVGKLTSHYPVWDAEGRLRTYVLLKKISDSLNTQNADAYLGIAYRTLLERGAEATELSRLTLNGKVGKVYADPESEKARHLAGTLLLMNREDEEFAKGLVEDAIHLWSDERFRRLLPDFKAVRMMSEPTRRDIEDMIEREIPKARRARNTVAVQRAKLLLETIIRSRYELPQVVAQ
jgi:hypothetical protein